MTNEELLAAVKTEIGWLRNELIRQRAEIEQQGRAIDQSAKLIQELRDMR